LTFLFLLENNKKLSSQPSNVQQPMTTKEKKDILSEGKLLFPFSLCFVNRVTGLGEFSPIGPIDLASVFENYRRSTNLESLFPVVKVTYYFF
jgi:hypothetical protein